MSPSKMLPLVTVIIPINKEHAFLEESLESVFSQEYPNFEILIVDNSELGLESLSLYSKLNIHRVPSSYGLSKSMNYGFKHAKGDYIFVMHSDDIANPLRISRQVEYMESNPSVDILGAGIEIIGDGNDSNMNKGDIFDRTESNGRIKEFLMYKNPLFHPTVVFRSKSLLKLETLYRSKYDCVEDLELWVRASRKLEIANISDVLLKYRIHGNQLGQIKGPKSEMLSSLIRVRHNLWVIFHISNLRVKATRAFGRSIIKLIQSLPRYIFNLLRFSID
jgi:glycosyltransferase involved in cell wall biosynthesis